MNKLEEIENTSLEELICIYGRIAMKDISAVVASEL